MNRKSIRNAKKTRCKFYTQPYKCGRTREAARRYYFLTEKPKARKTIVRKAV